MSINILDFDRIDENPENGGKKFYGKDDGNGMTDWYDENGNLDCSTETPEEDDEYQRRLSE